MAGHMPYIMPGGHSLTAYLKAERERDQRLRTSSSARPRAKDEQFASLVIQRTNASSEFEIAELKAIEAAGVRRRRRWFNEKVLRDMAGPLSARDMESQFKPAPFGATDHERPLMQALRPEHAALWDNFRNIDPEREARVLQKWADHQAEQRHPGGRRRPVTPAEVALKRWARVGKKARAALKRANASSVLQLELQVLDFVEQSAPGEQLVLPLEDGFARLLVHGLADFYDLLSASKDVAGQQAVVVYRRAAAAAAASPGASPARGATPSGGSSSSGVQGVSPARGAVAGASPGRGAAAGASPPPGRGGVPPAARSVAAAASDLLCPGEHEITCTDILLAMMDVGQMGLNQESLQRYVSTHIHGTHDDGALERQLQQQRAGSATKQRPGSATRQRGGSAPKSRPSAG